MKAFLLFLLPMFFLSNEVEGQNRYVFSETEELSVILPGEVYYENTTKHPLASSEELYNDIFSLDLLVFTGTAYNYVPDLSVELKEMASDYEYRQIKPFKSGKLSDTINYMYYTGYDTISEFFVVFGVIQDFKAKKHYEIELTLYEFSTDAASKIIDSIMIRN